jgi:protein-L-isoaspartate O-methyltransferase
MNAELLAQVGAAIVAAIAAGAGVYAAIKADLTRAIVTADQAHQAAEKAHGRLDVHIEHHNERAAP